MSTETELLSEFFKEKVDEARRHQNVLLLGPTQHYVVQLLSDFTRAEKLHSDPNDQPIATLYAKAVASHGFEQYQTLKVIGDRTLYVSGFFGDSFKRKIFDIDYYIAMGEQAYGSISTSESVFTELSEKFGKLVNILSEISETSGITSDTDLLRMYERWLATRSDHLSKKLKEAGILVTDAKKEYLH